MIQPFVAGLLLAAGAGRRYGMPKAFVEVRGHRLVEHGLATLRDGGCHRLVVVLGAAAAQVRASSDLSGATVTDNPDRDSGMGSSLRAGLATLASSTVDAVAVLVVDTPAITAAAVQRLRALGTPAALAVATYNGQHGHPVLLGRHHWSAAMAMASGDVGARRYLAAHSASVTQVPCEDIADGADVDIPHLTDTRRRR